MSNQQTITISKQIKLKKALFSLSDACATQKFTEAEIVWLMIVEPEIIAKAKSLGLFDFDENGHLRQLREITPADWQIADEPAKQETQPEPEPIEFHIPEPPQFPGTGIKLRNLERVRVDGYWLFTGLKTEIAKATNYMERLGLSVRSKQNGKEDYRHKLIVPYWVTGEIILI